jgi:uncharacterized protein YhaN
MLEQRERLERIEQERLPDLQRRLLSAEEVARLASEADRLEEQIDGYCAADPGLRDVEPTLSAAAYGQREQELTEGIEMLRERRSALLQRASAALDRYQAEYSSLLHERERLATALRRAREFRDAVELARRTLQQIGDESHQDWARRLDQLSMQVVPALSGRYTRMRFDRDLRFVVTDEAGHDWDQIEVHSRLSAGARDQLYLALRLILAESFFGSAASVPILLDDPFVSFDDLRFESAFMFLIDQVIPRHQVILTSCHEARHRELLARHPALAGRVTIVHLEPSRQSSL